MLHCYPDFCFLSMADHMQITGNQATNKDGLPDLQKTTNQGKFTTFTTIPKPYRKTAHTQRHYHAILFTLRHHQPPCMHFISSTRHSKWSLMPQSIQGFDGHETQYLKLVELRCDTAMHGHAML